METRELDFFKKVMLNNILKAAAGGVVLTDFLDEYEQAIIKQLPKENIQILYQGGFGDAEQNRVMFLPKEYKVCDFKICVFEILYNTRFLTLNHRKVLGSLMGLGIQRKSIGDIYLKEQKAYFACTKEIAPFIKSSFTQISRMPIQLKEVMEQITIQKNWKYQNVIVSSLRLDVIVAAAYHLSRKEVLEWMMAGFVYVHHQTCMNQSYIVKEKDVISVRHKGRIYLEQIGKKTRNDRMNVTLGFLL